MKLWYRGTLAKCTFSITAREISSFRLKGVTIFVDCVKCATISLKKNQDDPPHLCSNLPPPPLHTF